MAERDPRTDLIRSPSVAGGVGRLGWGTSLQGRGFLPRSGAAASSLIFMPIPDGPVFTWEELRALPAEH